MRRAAAGILGLLLVGCGSTVPATVPPPPRVDCGPLDQIECDAVADAVLSVVADAPSAPIVVEIEDGSFCADHLFDSASCPPLETPDGAVWTGRAEVLFGNSYVSGFYNVVAGPDRVDATQVSMAARPQPSPTD